ncbi:MAG TPA: DUF6526 family protein [Bryobacteraceae bacterium]|nr:DUF6526 family protein [Bryobacteraceae bacterium]
MAGELSQTYANHVRFHPPYHYFLVPATFVLLILTIVNVVRHVHRLDAWILLVIGILAPLGAFLMRLYPLKVQDRLIRLEERLRLQALLGEPLRSRIGELTEAQVIALRFASDGELPGLVEKVLSSNMTNADIKKAVVHWRADTFRV